MPPVCIDEPGRVEDLQRAVRVERRHDLRDRTQVAVDELAETAAVSGRPRHEELEPRRTERVLTVDGEQAEPERIPRRGSDCVLQPPGLGLRRAFFVPNPPDLLDAFRREVRRE